MGRAVDTEYGHGEKDKKKDSSTYLVLTQFLMLFSNCQIKTRVEAVALRRSEQVQVRDTKILWMTHKQRWE